MLFDFMVTTAEEIITANGMVFTDQVIDAATDRFPGECEDLAADGDLRYMTNRAIWIAESNLGLE